jgi:hypothetical protein
LVINIILIIYIFVGRGQKKTTQRRVLIYERESGIIPKERNDKKPRRKQSNEISWDYEAAGYKLDHSSLSTSKNDGNIVNVDDFNNHEVTNKVDIESDDQHENQDNENNPYKKLKVENILLSSTNGEDGNEIINRM